MIEEMGMFRHQANKHRPISSGIRQGRCYIRFVSVTINLPEELLADVFHVSEPEVPGQVLIELACALYARRALTHAQAAALAGLDRFKMGEELARRDIARHYTEDDLAADLTYGGQ